MIGVDGARRKVERAVEAREGAGEADEHFAEGRVDLRARQGELARITPVRGSPTHIEVECPVEVVCAELAEMGLRPMVFASIALPFAPTKEGKTHLVPHDGIARTNPVQASEERKNGVDDERDLLPQVGQDLAANSALRAF